MRFDHRPDHRVEHPHTGELAAALLAVGAPVDGPPGSAETPLITAASYGDADVARILIAAGAELEATGTAVPGGTALSHAIVFGMTEVADLLLASGARIPSAVEAAVLGEVTAFLRPGPTEADRVRALRLAAGNGRLEVIDQLLLAGTPIDGADEDGSTALHEAAWSGKPDAVRLLLAHGADPDRCDTTFAATPLGWAQHRLEEIGPGWGHAEVLRILAGVERTVERP